MQTFRFIVGAVVFLALLYLSLQNSAVVELTIFNVAALKAPLIVVVFVSFASGVAVGLLAGALRASRLKRQVSKLRREQRDGGGAPAIANGPVYPRGDRTPDDL
ncbi:MAG: LapA family protein [Burkholderiales bacterium]